MRQKYTNYTNMGEMAFIVGPWFEVKTTKEIITKRKKDHLECIRSHDVPLKCRKPLKNSKAMKARETST